MTENRHTPAVIKDKRGIPVYQTNPSVPDPSEIKKFKLAKLGNDKKGVVVDGGTGEILGPGAAMVYEWEEVDKERFVKLYFAGLKQAVGLSKAASSVFEIVYYQVRSNPGKDQVQLAAATSNLEERTYQRGLRELLEKGFLFRSPFDGVFFVKIRFMFNGDRLAFVKAYRLKGSQNHPELPFDGPLAIMPPDDKR